jgi:hypothetical protein
VTEVSRNIYEPVDDYRIPDFDDLKNYKKKRPINNIKILRNNFIFTKDAVKISTKSRVYLS